jgi:predicted lysophospholipase L1 biosynthesis ABC-type transport system permease subunit
MANAQLQAAAAEYHQRFPRTLPPQASFAAERLIDVLVRDIRPSLILLAIAVAVVLLIACTNVTNLLLVRGAARAREMAIRAAFGATRGRLIRQLLTESAVLASVGSICGLILGYLEYTRCWQCTRAAIQRLLGTTAPAFLASVSRVPQSPSIGGSWRSRLRSGPR